MNREVIEDARSAELVEGLDRCELESLSHEDHVRVAWHLLKTTQFAPTLARLPKMLQRCATSKGMPNHYHETITVAFISLIHERMHDNDTSIWSAFASSNADLLDPAILKRYYNRDTLNSALARRVFVLPTIHAGACLMNKASDR